MSVNSFTELKSHIGHDVRCVAYGPAETPVNVAIECETCGTVLVDYDADDIDENEYRQRARVTYHDVDIDIEDQADVSRGSGGAYVQAWVWVPKTA